MITLLNWQWTAIVNIGAETQALVLLNLQIDAVQLPLGRVRRARAQDDAGAFSDITTNAKAQVIMFE